MSILSAIMLLDYLGIFAGGILIENLHASAFAREENIPSGDSRLVACPMPWSIPPTSLSRTVASEVALASYPESGDGEVYAHLIIRSRLDGVPLLLSVAPRFLCSLFRRLSSVLSPFEPSSSPAPSGVFILVFRSEREPRSGIRGRHDTI